MSPADRLSEYFAEQMARDTIRQIIAAAVRLGLGRKNSDEILAALLAELDKTEK